MFSKFALEQPISCKVLNNVFINKHFWYKIITFGKNICVNGVQES